MATTLISVGGSNGGFFPESWRWASLALSCLAGAGLLLRDSVRLSAREVAALATLSTLTGWMLLSRASSMVPGLAVPEAERALLYVAGLLACVVWFERAATRSLLVGLLVAVSVLSLWGLVDYAASFGSRPAGWPLVGPVGYANAAGVLAAVGITISVGLAIDAHGRVRRFVWLSTLALLVPTLALSKSGGASLALGGGLVVIALPHLRRLSTPFLAIAAIAVGAGVTVWLLQSSVQDNIRWSYWRIALQDYWAHPLLGSGAGTFGHYWTLHSGSRTGVLDAHSLYLESLAELGPLGLLLVGAFLALVVRSAVTDWQGVTPVALAAFVTYALHAAVDWDWEMPVVTLCAILLASILLNRGRPASDPLTARRQLALALAAAALAILVVIRLKTGSSTI